MNGNISNNIEGAFKKVKYIGSKKFSSVSLKNLFLQISSLLLSI